MLPSYGICYGYPFAHSTIYAIATTEPISYSYLIRNQNNKRLFDRIPLRSTEFNKMPTGKNV